MGRKGLGAFLEVYPVEKRPSFGILRIADSRGPGRRHLVQTRHIDGGVECARHMDTQRLQHWHTHVEGTTWTCARYCYCVCMGVARVTCPSVRVRAYVCCRFRLRALVGAHCAPALSFASCWQGVCLLAMSSSSDQWRSDPWQDWTGIPGQWHSGPWHRSMAQPQQ